MSTLAEVCQRLDELIRRRAQLDQEIAYTEGYLRYLAACRANQSKEDAAIEERIAADIQRKVAYTQASFGTGVGLHDPTGKNVRTVEQIQTFPKECLGRVIRVNQHK